MEEKERKLKEAMDRGEITVANRTSKGKKRPRMDADSREESKQKLTKQSQSEQARAPRIVHPLPAKPVLAVPVEENSSEDESSSRGSDMDPEKDAISSKPPPGFTENSEKDDVPAEPVRCPNVLCLSFVKLR